jgi:hypothetical protein
LSKTEEINMNNREHIGSAGSDRKTKKPSAPIPHESTVGAISCKGTGGFTSLGPLGISQNASRLINRRLSQNCAYVPA